jgi:DNA-binding NtrC family response regulator
MSAAAPLLLVVDDQPDVLQAVRLLLKAEGWQVETASGPAEALQLAGKKRFDAALIDLNYTRDTTSGQEGLALLRELKALDNTLPVAVMTAWGSIDLAVEAVRRGAGDFVEKPWENQRLMSVLSNQVALGRAERRGARLAAENALLRGGEHGMVARARSMQPVLELIERVAPSAANVLITGENGTGKGLIAQAIHAASLRSGEAFIKVNMGGINEHVFESEMFGHVRGAFTDAKADRVGRFELADNGSLFLDEIGNIPVAQQAKLLRVLEDGEFERVGASRTLTVDVRILSATNADLAGMVERGQFRRDLLFRLNTVEIRLPPLRDRAEDIEPLAQMFLQRHAQRYQREIAGLSPSALSALQRHRWPGNVRELNHVIERAVLMSRGQRIESEDLLLSGAPGEAAPPATTAAGFGELAAMTLEEAEQHLVRAALERCAGNVHQAAEVLGVSRSALYRRLEKFGLGRYEGGEE